MKIIGLLPKNKDLERELRQLEKAGFGEGQITTLSRAKDIFQLLNCQPASTTVVCMVCGALLVGGFYTVAAALAGWCECNLFGFGIEIAVDTLIAGILVGSFIGAVLGMFIGVGNYEAKTHLYTQGTHSGGQVIVLDTEQEEEAKAIQILKKEGFIGVKTLQES
jgi:hypothetical protein